MTEALYPSVYILTFFKAASSKHFFLWNNRLAVHNYFSWTFFSSQNLRNLQTTNWNHWSTGLWAITSCANKLLPLDTNFMVLYNTQLVCLPRRKHFLVLQVLTPFTTFGSKWQQVMFRVCTSRSNVENSFSSNLSARTPEIAFSRSITKSQTPWPQNCLFIFIAFHTSKFTEFDRTAHEPLAYVFVFSETQSFLVVSFPQDLL